MPAEHPAVIIDTRHSRYARLHPVPGSAVMITDEFWAPRLERNAVQTLPFAHEQCRSTGALDNFARAAGRIEGPFRGRYYSDSDVYKWVESACWSLAGRPDPQLRARVDETVRLIAGAQDDDGYLNTYFSVDRVAERWSDLVVRHELYCLGHLIQAAVAHRRATGTDDLLDVALRAAALVERRFPPGEVPGCCGHPNLELALIELSRETGDERWRRLAGWQLDSRGRGVLDGSEYLLDHAPLRHQDRVTGHAVRALYLYAAAADLLLEQDDLELAATVDALWRDLVRHKISVTGGAGARWDGEAFGDAYELPDRAYNESCAAIALIMLAWRLLLRTGDGGYRDVAEWALYNAVLPGLSASGTDFFYQNPLADAGRHRRRPWFDCACCPPNITRILASLPGYLLSRSEDGIWLNLIMAGRAETALADGTPVGLELDAGLPYRGELTVRVTLPRKTRFTLRLPSPGWADGAVVTVNGETVPAPVEDGYLVLERKWRDGDEVTVEYGMGVRLLAAHPFVASAHGRVALTRGPLVYCVEQADHDVDVRGLRLTGREQWKSIDLAGVEALTTEGRAEHPTDDRLHAPWQPSGPAPTEPVAITAIPYFAWANREPGPMTVLLPLTCQN